MGACTNQPVSAANGSQPKPAKANQGRAMPVSAWPSTPTRAAACCASEAADDDDRASDHHQGARPAMTAPSRVSLLLLLLSRRGEAKKTLRYAEMQCRAAHQAGVDGIEWITTTTTTTRQCIVYGGETAQTTSESAMHATHQSGRLVCSSFATTSAAMDPRCGRAQPMQRMA
ncbi:hypothetical protein COCCADRAFT_32560 [Bipolaris zeicola 26-R-13]|uniref:Uncharacterized protein n=1 Tax=Cochliobolus carbonum (strain 26-R-13) TaxID=930089 RepID=W6YSH8_COCC2|nr:uncharacterized protein COCCADRAFT_32560 [Bipolaris zeicola 26-R-13]EUC38359.1 hypothetical protein COCCADRAFT_32560 [Bipolaris zeicola 26-R-13]